MKKSTIAALCMLGGIAANAQELRLSSAIHPGQAKVTVYREWPERKLIDTPKLENGQAVLKLPGGNAMYSIRLAKPWASANVLVENGPVTITVGKDSLVTVRAGRYQAKLTGLERSLAPVEKAWQLAGREYETATDLDAKLRVSEAMNKYAADVQEKRLAFVLANSSNIAGAWSAYQYAFAWTPASLARLLPAFRGQAWAKDTYDALLKKQEEAAARNMTGVAAPLFTLPSIDGRLVRLDSLLQQNKYVLVDVWASWCTPCRAANRKLAAHYDELRKKGIGLVSVSVDEKRDLWEKAVAADKIPWVQLLSQQGMKSEVVQQYKVKSLPATFLINREGTIIRQHVEIEDLQKLN